VKDALTEKYCVDCLVEAPKEESDHTPISSKYGWRLTYTTADGRKKMEWRCPQCWAKYRHKIRSVPGGVLIAGQSRNRNPKE
jgi:hypothetical protein